MSSESNPSRGVRNAKKKALDNAVWLPVKMRGKRQQHDMASTQSDKASTQPDKASAQHDKASSQREKASSQHNTASSAQGDPQWGSQPRSKPKTVKKQSRYISPVAEEDKVETQHQSPDTSDSEQLGEPWWGSQPRPKPKLIKKYHQDEAKAVKKHKRQQSESEADDDSDRTNFDGADSSSSDLEDPKSIAKTLSTEIPGFVSSTKAKNQAVVTVNKQSACTRKRASETPMWADDASESEESRDESAPKSDSDTSTFVKSEQDLSDAERMGSESSSRHSGSSRAKLVLTDNGKVKMTDQDIATRKVIQGGILEAKAYMMFVNGYLELIEKTTFSRDALLKSACDRGATSIEMEIKKNDAYASALASLGS
ncbi:hypothetical protein DFJ58DRAFT_725660 [Suillus subalutaceus]|uniref:uncharacterized protein n=1 Tax=Suillus subalutaceus TaxID=48586 RepID=UPI001B8696A7|nr:uncharacterized protein DFJ58DRAFT_725660 [Suillus subalutaceus]KAG1861816.1 hypothetical protein DFJ58DRAFT_725660 [Suillus subalutaceus]